MLVGSFGNKAQLTFGEKERYLEQIAVIEKERDTAVRRSKQLDIENQVLRSHRHWSRPLTAPVDQSTSMLPQ